MDDVTDLLLTQADGTGTSLREMGLSEILVGHCQIDANRVRPSDGLPVLFALLADNDSRAATLLVEQHYGSGLDVFARWRDLSVTEFYRSREDEIDFDPHLAQTLGCMLANQGPHKEFLLRLRVAVRAGISVDFPADLVDAIVFEWLYWPVE